jgi:plasmid stabilization system protein ParE
VTFRVLPEANGDVTEILAWLVRRRRYRVVQSVWLGWQTGLDAIKANPQMYPPAEATPTGVEVRFHRLPRSTYRIVYVVRPGEIVVLALTSGLRRVEPWQSRLPVDPPPEAPE